MENGPNDFENIEPKEKMPFASPENKQELKRIIVEMHSVRPDFIFFTMTSAFNVAVALKEAWKTAYPNEDTPLFYSVNPHGYESEKVLNEFNKKMKAIGEKEELKDKKILIFDEYKGDPEYGAYREPVKYNDQMRPDNSRLEQATIMVKNYIGSGENIYTLGAHAPKLGGSIFGRNENTGDNLEVKKIYSRLITPDTNHHEEVVRVAKGKEGGEIFEKLKQIGGEAGSEIIPE